jgi:hypothetical protein
MGEARVFLLPRKFYWNEEDRYLSLGELYSLGLDAAIPPAVTSKCEELNIVMVDNTPQEILQIVEEVESRLSGTWVESEADEELQERYRTLVRDFDMLPSDFKIKYKVGAKFLRENSSWFLRQPNTETARLFFYIDGSYRKRYSITKHIAHIGDDNRYHVVFDMQNREKLLSFPNRMREIKFAPASRPIALTISKSEIMYQQSDHWVSCGIEIKHSNGKLSDGEKYVFKDDEPFFIFDTSLVDFSRILYISISGFIEEL